MPCSYTTRVWIDFLPENNFAVGIIIEVPGEGHTSDICWSDGFLKHIFKGSCWKPSKKGSFKSY